MICVMPSTDTARHGPTIMSRRLGIVQPVFTVAATKARWSGRHLGLGEGRHVGREAIEPGHELRMRGAPVAAEAEIAVTEETSERDLADMGDRIERRRIGFERVEAALDLVGL